MDIQSCIQAAALTVVHNFICCHQPVEDDETEDEDGPGGVRVEGDNDGDDGAELVGVGVNELDARRDDIASIIIYRNILIGNLLCLVPCR